MHRNSNFDSAGRSIGIKGNAFVSVIISFGCNIPAGYGEHWEPGTKRKHFRYISNHCIASMLLAYSISVLAYQLAIMIVSYLPNCKPFVI